MTKKRVLLVDDHPLLRAGMSNLINNEPGFQVCGEVAEARQTLDAIRTTKADIIVLDISMQGENGLEILKAIKALYPELAVLILSMHDETVYAPRALRAGASGYVSKDDPPETFVQALRKVAEGGLYVSEIMSSTLLNQMARGKAAVVSSPVETLSDRELEVFTMLGKGLNTREIAGKMGLSIKTVESHRAHIKEKLRIDKAPALLKHAVTWVTEEGLNTTDKR